MNAAMFNVKSVVHGANGAVDVELIFDRGAGQESDLRSFPSADHAAAYVQSCKKTYILQRMEKFVAHKVKIAETSHDPFYHSAARAKSIDYLHRLLAAAQDKNLVNICRAILKSNTSMVNILPVPANHSFESSVAEINAIMIFCLENANMSN